MTRIFMHLILCPKLAFKFRFKIGTGHFEYPTNKLREATVEILLTSSETEIEDFVVTSDDYLVVGIAELSVN